MHMKRGNEATYIYMKSKVLRGAKKMATGWFHLSEAEQQALEDDVVAMLETKEEVESDKGV